MKVIIQKTGQQVTLEQNDYIAGGGEGKVYGKGGSAFKIYHNPKKMIPLGKIHELCKLTPPNVLAPRDIVLSPAQKPIGFTMRLIPDTVFLTWLFNRGWKQQNGVTDEILLKIVKRMRETTITLHSESCVVGDYNEMQFLLSKDYSDVFFCDTDSYQTASFPCTAVMDTIRDRTVPFGSFSIGTDWFAYAVVTFQLWTGIHPYMCKHPQYNKKDAKQFVLMEKNISAYSPDATLPKQALPLSVIPPDLSAWYKDVFVNKARYEPPLPGAPIPVAAQRLKKVLSTGSFKVEVIADLPELIRNVFILNSNIYCVTDSGVYSGDRPIIRLTKNRNYAVVSAQGSYDPVLIKDDGELEFFTKDAKCIDTASFDFYTVHNDKLFSVKDGSVYMHTFSKMMGQVFHEQKQVDEVYGRRNIKIFPGTIYQDVLGVPWFLFLNKDGTTSNQQAALLNNYRIIDARYDKDVLMVIAEKGGQYFKAKFIVQDNYTVLALEPCQPSDSANFIVLDKGVVVSMVDDDLNLEIPLAGAKIVSNPPFDNSMPLYTDGARVLVVNDNRLLYVSMT